SIIIATYNRADILKKAVVLLKKQKTDVDFEVLIVDDGSDEKNKKKLKLLEKDSRFRFFYRKKRGPAGARNFGILKSKNDVLIFMNDDTFVSTDFVKRHFEFHKTNKNEEVFLTGPMINYPKFRISPAMEWLLSRSNLHFDYSNTDNANLDWGFFWTCNVSLKKKFLLKNNLFFDENFPKAAWEDFEFAYRASLKGMKLFYDEKLTVYHYHKFNFDDVLNRFFNHGRGLYFLEQKVPAKYLPPMGKDKSRKLLRFFLFISMSCFWLKISEKRLKKSKKISNILMQLLVLAEKLKGYDFEKRKIR
ncbi:glycosyltransferase, partial [Patescibacteria group bacterium]|nr:glycosyltransferase [Patescibacteria group bacterium]